MKTNLLLLSATGTLFLFAACQTAEPAVSTERSALVTSPAVGAQLTAFPLHLQRLSNADVARRSGAFAATLLGQSLPSASFAAAVNGAAVTPSGLSAALPDNPSVKLSHRPGLSETLVINEQVTRDVFSLPDVGEPAARSIFAGAFGSIVASGEVAPTGLDPTAPQYKRLMQGEGRSGQAPVERIKEYVYTVPRKINGIEVAGSGVEISVHRSGKLARLKSFGPVVDSSTDASGNETPGAGGYSFTRAVSQSDLLARAVSAHPGADLKPLGLMYVLPEGATDAVVEPTEVFSIVPTATINGKTVHGRASVASYSVKDANVVPAIWPRPAIGAKGDPGK